MQFPLVGQLLALTYLMKELTHLPQNLREFEKAVGELGKMFRDASRAGGGSPIQGIGRRLSDAWHGIVQAEEVEPGKPAAPGQTAPGKTFRTSQPTPSTPSGGAAPQPETDSGERAEYFDAKAEAAAGSAVVGGRNNNDPLRRAANRRRRARTARDIAETMRRWNARNMEKGRAFAVQTEEEWSEQAAQKLPAAKRPLPNAASRPPTPGGQTPQFAAGAAGAAGGTGAATGTGASAGGAGAGAASATGAAGGGGGAATAASSLGGGAGAAGGAAAAPAAAALGTPVGLAIVGITTAVTAIVSFGKRVGECVQALREFAKEFNEHARSMAKFDAHIAQATGEQDMARMHMAWQRSQSAGPWASAAIQSRTDLEAVRQPIQQLGDKIGASITIATNRIEGTLTEMLNQLFALRTINSWLSWLAQKAGINTGMAPTAFSQVFEGLAKNAPEQAFAGPAEPGSHGMRGVSPRAPGQPPKEDSGVKGHPFGDLGAKPPAAPAPPQADGAHWPEFKEPLPEPGTSALGFGISLGMAVAGKMFGGGGAPAAPMPPKPK